MKILKDDNIAGQWWLPNTDNYVLQKFGGRPVDLKTYRDTIIIPAVDFYVQHGCSRKTIVTQARTLSESFHRFYETKAAHSRLRPGARGLLQWLQRHSYQSIILSNHTVVGIQQQLNRLHIAGYSLLGSNTPSACCG